MQELACRVGTYPLIRRDQISWVFDLFVLVVSLKLIARTFARRYSLFGHEIILRLLFLLRHRLLKKRLSCRIITINNFTCELLLKASLLRFLELTFTA
jgi:hypothetical protein